LRHALLSLGLLASPAAAEISLAEASLGLELVPCDLSDLSCATLTLPLDPRANDPEKTIDITFALSFAHVESRGILFYVVGGPGGSGLASADGYLSAFNPSLTDYMDIVFIDQRGTGPDHGLSCPVAQATFDLAPATLADAEDVLATAQAYVTDCIAELDAADLLPVVNSDYAVGDFEAFRRMIGAPKVWLYGESYGTQFVQAYATTYPKAVRGVIVDGVVDLNLSAEGFYRSYTLAAEKILSATFDACATIPACQADMGGDAAAVYDDLASRLAQSPVMVPLTLADGSRTDRPLTSALLETNAFYALYSAEGRGEFLRVLAAAGRGDLEPMLQLGYSNLYIDPETAVGMEDPGWFGAAYYAITCADYGSGQGTPEERAARIIDEARAFAPEAPRLLRSYYMERVACALWPYQGPDNRPAPYAGGDWPTLVLNGTGDPITPMPMAYSVLDNARNAYGVFMEGGPHVIWGRGFACPDSIVEALLYDGTLPAAREQRCSQDFIMDYLPLTLTDPADKADAFKVARAIETELLNALPLGNWDGESETSFGCPHGGTVTLSASEEGTHYAFADCRFWPDLALSGAGDDITMDDTGGGLILDLAVTGVATGQISYRSSPFTESQSLSGTWNGQPAALPRSWP
jgi:pimeloyl-ACP methyl ester carboxylesterase